MVMSLEMRMTRSQTTMRLSDMTEWWLDAVVAALKVGRPM